MLRGCRLILIFKAPTPKQAYPADFLAFQQRTFCGICLFFFTSPILGRKIPFLHICSSALAAKLSFDQIFLRISRSHGKETDDIYLYSGQLHTAWILYTLFLNCGNWTDGSFRFPWCPRSALRSGWNGSGASGSPSHSGCWHWMLLSVPPTAHWS